MRRRNNKVRYRGQTYRVIDRLAVRGKCFLILERLGTRQRPIFQAFDPRASLTGEMRCLHLLPYSRSTDQHLRVLSDLSSPHASLPTILECHRRQNDVVVVTQWIDGPSLRDYLRQARRGREPWPSPVLAVNLFRRLAHACWLLYHRLGLIHGDLKPENLIICRASPRLVPIDFGSAWRVERTGQRDTADGATRCYAAPELRSGHGKPGYRCDQFSATVVLYEMLTGKMPYDGIGGLAGEEAYKKHGQVPLIPPSRILRHHAYLPRPIKRQLDEVVQRGLALDPADRYQEGREWLDDLDRLKELMGHKIEISRANQWLLEKLNQLGQFFQR